MNYLPNSKFDLSGKIALITGAAGLLGYEHAHALLENGCSIVLSDVNQKKLNEISENFKKEFPNSKIYSEFLDVSDLKSVSKLYEKLKNKKVEIDILINNAAINPLVKNDSLIESSRLESFSNDQWDIEIKVGLTGAFNCSKIFGADMASRNSGNIVNIASDLGIIAPDQRLYKKNNRAKNMQPVKPVSYSVIKHGLIGLTKYLSTYWSDVGVRCNSLSPGGVKNNQGDEFLGRINNLIPLGRMANKDEYRCAIQFLCSDASSYMNGHNLVIDGGRSVW